MTVRVLTTTKVMIQLPVTAVLLDQARARRHYCTITTGSQVVLESLLIDTVGFLNEFKLVKSLSLVSVGECAVRVKAWPLYCPVVFGL